jgi:hypothetical protein
VTYVAGLMSPAFSYERSVQVVFSRRVSVLLALVVAALGIGLWGAVGFASPKDDGHNNDEGRTLTVLTKSRDAKVVDLKPQGPTHGDMRVVNAPLYNESGKKKIGHLDLYCVTTDPADEPSEKANMVECTYTYTLPSGEISVQGVSALPTLRGLPPKAVDAISGGTGKYAGVRGEASIKTRGNKAFTTFHFID